MNPRTLARRKKQLSDALEKPQGFSGSYELGEIGDYVDTIYAKLDKIIFEDFKAARDPEKTRDDYKRLIIVNLRRDHNFAQQMYELQSGKSWCDLAEILLKERLKLEMGEHYHDRVLDVDLPLNLDMDSPALSGIDISMGEKSLYLNPEGVALLSQRQKNTALRRQAAHIALGHAGKHAWILFLEREKLQYDADLITALACRNEDDVLSVLQYSAQPAKAQRGDEPFPLDAYITKLKTSLYKHSHKKPGQDDQFDAIVNVILQEKIETLYHVTESPHANVKGRMEEMLALKRKHEVQDGMYTPKVTADARKRMLTERLKKAAEENPGRSGRG